MAVHELSRRLKFERQCLLGIPRDLGGLVGRSSASDDDELPFSFELEVRSVCDFDFTAFCSS